MNLDAAVLAGITDHITPWKACYAARTAVETAARTVRDLRVAEVVKLDLTIDEGKVTAYRARLNISFKYEVNE